MQSEKREAFAIKMRRDGLPEVAIDAFLRAAEFVSDGGDTTISEAEIEPIDSLPTLQSLSSYAARGREAALYTVVLKLNGGLGTSMGLSKAKSLLPVRPGITFLDIIARQVLHQRREWEARLPLVMMNSYRTREDSLALLACYEGLEAGVPPDFLQHKVPRIDAETWAPVEWPEDPSLEWCPPGHGDLYIAMRSSGLLEKLLEQGYRTAFISNSDNLGAILDPALLGWFTSQGVPFAMEVAQRTDADKKGGHLARSKGRLLLRELAQCPTQERAGFQDVKLHRFFNTNNLWLDLRALSDALDASPSGLPLPVICNEKHVRAKGPESPRCYQLETAMGSAIECFEDGRAIVVPRTRFAPVKTTNDLLTLWSDAYQMTADFRMLPSDPKSHQSRLVDLDPRYFGHVDDLERRFAEGAPSLVKCRRLTVSGDHYFKANVVIEGDVELSNGSEAPIIVDRDSVLRG